MATRLETNSQHKSVDWAALAPQIQSTLEAGAAGVGAYGLKKTAELIIRGTLPAANVLIPVAMGTISATKEVLVGLRQEHHLGVAAFKNQWEKHNGFIGRLVNFPERIVSRAIISPESKIKQALSATDADSAYILLRQVQLLTGDFRYLDKDLAVQAKSKISEHQARLGSSDQIDLNIKAEKLAKETYYRTLAATSLVNGLKIGLVSLVGLNLSEQALEKMASSVINSEGMRKTLEQIGEVKAGLLGILGRNEALGKLTTELGKLKNDLHTSAGELSSKAVDLTNKIKRFDDQIEPIKHQLSANRLQSQKISESIKGLHLLKDSLKEKLISPATGWEVHSASGLPSGSGYLEALYRYAPYYTSEHGEWNALANSAKHLADHNPSFFVDGKQIASSLVDAHGNGPVEAVNSIATFDKLGIVLADGSVDTAKIHQISNLALSGDETAKQQLYDLLRWFKKSTKLMLPNEVNNVAEVISRREILQSQIDAGRSTLDSLDLQSEQLSHTLSGLQTSRQTLVQTLSDLHLDPTLISKILVTQQEISAIQAANNSALLEADKLLTSLTGNKFELSSPEQITMAISRLDELASSLSIVDRQSQSLNSLIQAETVATITLLGGAALANQVAQSHPDTQLHRADFAPQGATNYFDRLQIITP